ncbi:MAG: methionine--tRNA ligase [Denitrovibrio sp.]|nr:MAG: methionine--tRNA ligase [Denitrovibrio sp.]
MKDNTFYITTPIYYVNDVPHIGHAYTTVACDSISRYKRLCGYEVCFLTGTDEHGQKIEQAAEKRGITPKQLADEVVERFAGLWKTLNISNDKFVRTTDELHKKAVRKIFNKMKENGDIYIDHYEGWYCTPCETYLTETQLLDGNCCPSCGRETAMLKEPSYFFRMSKYGDTLLKHIEDNPDFVRPQSRRNEIVSFIKDGLRDLSVSRATFKWGIPVPDDEEHVIYVWIDALTNYISALGYGEDGADFEKFWPATYHVVGKDILRFHTVYWPTMLLSAGISLPDAVFAHGWWTVEGQKMSKSLGNAIDPNWLVEKFGVDAIRYFLLREVPFGLDGDFSFKALIHRINGDLANDLGNLLNRTMGMVNRYFDGTVQPYSEAGPEDKALEETIERVFKEVDEHITNMAFNKALMTTWELVSALNKYIDETAPWALAKDEARKARLGSVLYSVLDGLKLVSLLVDSFMPETAMKIRRQLGATQEINVTDAKDLCKIRTFESGHKLGEAEQLFPRIEEKEMLEALKKETDDKKQDDEGEPVVEEIEFAHFEKMVLKAAKVLECEKVKKSDKLLKLQLDLGTEKRQVVSGIAKSYQPADLIGKTLVLVANLKPAKLMGTLSEGMILSATVDGKKHKVLELPDSVEPGTDIK